MKSLQKGGRTLLPYRGVRLSALFQKGGVEG